MIISDGIIGIKDLKLIHEVVIPFQDTTEIDQSLAIIQVGSENVFDLYDIDDFRLSHRFSKRPLKKVTVNFSIPQEPSLTDCLDFISPKSHCWFILSVLVHFRAARLFVNSVKDQPGHICLKIYIDFNEINTIPVIYRKLFSRFLINLGNPVADDDSSRLCSPDLCYQVFQKPIENINAVFLKEATPVFSKTEAPSIEHVEFKLKELGLISKLRPYQQKAVNWMGYREAEFKSCINRILTPNFEELASNFGPLSAEFTSAFNNLMGENNTNVLTPYWQVIRKPLAPSPSKSLFSCFVVQHFESNEKKEVTAQNGDRKGSLIHLDSISSKSSAEDVNMSSSYWQIWYNPVLNEFYVDEKVDACENADEKVDACENADEEADACDNADEEADACDNADEEADACDNADEEADACENADAVRNSSSFDDIHVKEESNEGLSEVGTSLGDFSRIDPNKTVIMENGDKDYAETQPVLDFDFEDVIFNEDFELEEDFFEKTPTPFCVESGSFVKNLKIDSLEVNKIKNDEIVKSEKESQIKTKLIKEPLFSFPFSGGVLADEMGLGKTIEVLSHILLNKENDISCSSKVLLGPVVSYPEDIDECSDIMDLLKLIKNDEKLVDKTCAKSIAAWELGRSANFKGFSVDYGISHAKMEKMSLDEYFYVSKAAKFQSFLPRCVQVYANSCGKLLSDRSDIPMKMQRKRRRVDHGDFNIASDCSALKGESRAEVGSVSLIVECSEVYPKFISSNSALYNPERMMKTNLLVGCVCSGGENIKLLRSQAEKHVPVAVCRCCGKYFHACCMGLKPRDDKSLLSSVFFRCPNCIGKSGDLLPTHATLIVAPKSIIGQWQKEFDHHCVKNTLRTIIYSGVDGMNSQRHCGGTKFGGDLNGTMFVHRSAIIDAGIDVVFVSFETLKTELEAALNTTRYMRRETVNSDSKSLRVSPLTQLFWRRIIVDEAQMVGGSSVVSNLLNRLHSRFRWAVSGTPFSGISSAQDAAGLLTILGFPLLNKNSFSHSPYDTAKIAIFEFFKKLLKDPTLFASKVNHIPLDHEEDSVFKNLMNQFTTCFTILGQNVSNEQLMALNESRESFSMGSVTNNQSTVSVFSEVNKGLFNYVLESFAALLGKGFHRTTHALAEGSNLPETKTHYIQQQLTSYEVVFYNQQLETARESVQKAMFKLGYRDIDETPALIGESAEARRHSRFVSRVVSNPKLSKANVEIAGELLAPLLDSVRLCCYNTQLARTLQSSNNNSSVKYASSLQDCALVAILSLAVICGSCYVDKEFREPNDQKQDKGHDVSQLEKSNYFLGQGHVPKYDVMREMANLKEFNNIKAHFKDGLKRSCKYSFLYSLTSESATFYNEWSPVKLSELSLQKILEIFKIDFAYLLECSGVLSHVSTTSSLTYTCQLPCFSKNSLKDPLIASVLEAYGDDSVPRTVILWKNKNNEFKINLQQEKKGSDSVFYVPWCVWRAFFRSLEMIWQLPTDTSYLITVLPHLRENATDPANIRWLTDSFFDVFDHVSSSTSSYEKLFKKIQSTLFHHLASNSGESYSGNKNGIHSLAIGIMQNSSNFMSLDSLFSNLINQTLSRFGETLRAVVFSLNAQAALAYGNGDVHSAVSCYLAAMNIIQSIEGKPGSDGVIISNSGNVAALSKELSIDRVQQIHIVCNLNSMLLKEEQNSQISEVDAGLRFLRGKYSFFSSWTKKSDVLSKISMSEPLDYGKSALSSLHREIDKILERISSKSMEFHKLFTQTFNELKKVWEIAADIVSDCLETRLAAREQLYINQSCVSCKILYEAGRNDAANSILIPAKAAAVNNVKMSDFASKSDEENALPGCIICRTRTSVESTRGLIDIEGPTRENSLNVDNTFEFRKFLTRRSKMNDFLMGFVFFEEHRYSAGSLVKANGLTKLNKGFIDLAREFNKCFAAVEYSFQSSKAIADAKLRLRVVKSQPSDDYNDGNDDNLSYFDMVQKMYDAADETCPIPTAHLSLYLTEKDGFSDYQTSIASSNKAVDDLNEVQKYLGTLKSSGELSKRNLISTDAILRLNVKKLINSSSVYLLNCLQSDENSNNTDDSMEIDDHDDNNNLLSSVAKKSFDCPVCYEYSEDRTVFTCQHTICVCCFHLMWIQRERLLKSKNSQAPVTCPICRHLTNVGDVLIASNKYNNLESLIVDLNNKHTEQSTINSIARKSKNRPIQVSQCDTSTQSCDPNNQTMNVLSDWSIVSRVSLQSNSLKRIQDMGTKMAAICSLVQRILARCPSEKIVILTQWTRSFECIVSSLKISGFAVSYLTGNANHDSKAVEQFSLSTPEKYSRPMTVSSGKSWIPNIKTGESAESLPEDWTEKDKDELSLILKSRLERLYAHRNERTSVFVTHLARAGRGLTLTAANHVILCEPWLSIADEDQAIGRIVRFGQTRATNVWRLYGAETIEERILELNETQRDVSPDKRNVFSFSDLCNVVGVC